VILRLYKPVYWLFEDYTRNVLVSMIMLNTEVLWKLRQVMAGRRRIPDIYTHHK